MRTSLLINAALLPGNPGGIANYVFHLTRHLVSSGSGLEITLLVPAHMREFFAKLEGVRLTVVPFRSQWVKFVLNQVWVPWLARRHALVHSVGNYGLLLRAAPQTIFVHDTYEKVSPDRFGRIKRRLLSFLVARTGAQSRVVLTNSENTRNDIVRYYPHLEAKTHVTLLGTKFPVQEAIPEGPREGFLFVGTLEPGKRVGDVVDAHAKAHFARPHPLRIVGQIGWGSSDLREKARTTGAGARVEFLGYVSDEDLRELYRTSLALIQASSYEGFGLPVVEAMACGCPVLAAENSALAEVGAGAALFFPTGDVTALAGAMERLAADSGLQRELSEKSLQRARDFTWEKTARKTLDAFAQAVAPDEG